MASGNPAELKLYDVPKFNGTVETMSSGTGDFNGGPPFPSVSGSAVTTGASDLQLGALADGQSNDHPGYVLDQLAFKWGERIDLSGQQCELPN